MNPMSIQVIDDLYRELLFTALILLLILLYNSLVLYKRALNDRLSLMLLAAASMCIFELLWDYCDGHLNLAALTYIGGCGYVLSFILFGVTFSRFFLERFGLLPRRKWLNELIYRIPVVFFFLLCITTPLTRLLFSVDENGILQEMPLFGTLFYALLLVYLLPSIGLPLYYAFRGKHKKPETVRTARSLLVFAILAPGGFLLQILVLGNPDSDYLALSLAIAVALVYLVTDISTHSLLETRAQIEAAEADLRIAAKIQIDALPPAAPVFANHPELSLRAAMHTAREVGGDFYDYFVIDENHICFLIADVSGKGTPAALFMMTAKTMIKDYALICSSTAEIFTAVNARLSENNREGMFATAWIGILDTRTGCLQYTNAGHNYPVLQRFKEPCVLLKKRHGLFLAGMDDTEYSFGELQMKPGDRLLLYTDGITEAHDKSGGFYGTERLFAAMEAAGEDNTALLDAVIRDVNDFASGVPQFDDITMLAISIKPKEE